MSKKQEFIKYVKELQNHCPDVEMNEETRLYWETFSGGANGLEKPMFTDNGKLILKYLQDNSQNTAWKAKEIAEGLGISSRTASGAMHKLVVDGYVEKLSQDPVVYTLTENGKNITIE